MVSKFKKTTRYFNTKIIGNSKALDSGQTIPDLTREILEFFELGFEVKNSLSWISETILGFRNSEITLEKMLKVLKTRESSKLLVFRIKTPAAYAEET